VFIFNSIIIHEKREHALFSEVASINCSSTRHFCRDRIDRMPST